MHVHICESISSHDVDNFMKNTLITYIMIIQILLYTGSSYTDKLTYIFSKRTHVNEQLMLLDYEIVYINESVILTRHKSSIHNILNTEIVSICYNIIIQLYHIIFKYCRSIILTDIIICYVCKTLYLYVSSVYTVIWHAIIMPSFISKYLIKDPLQKNLSTYSMLYGQTNPMYKVRISYLL